METRDLERLDGETDLISLGTKDELLKPQKSKSPVKTYTQEIFRKLKMQILTKL